MNEYLLEVITNPYGDTEEDEIARSIRKLSYNRRRNHRKQLQNSAQEDYDGSFKR